MVFISNLYVPIHTYVLVRSVYPYNIANLQESSFTFTQLTTFRPLKIHVYKGVRSRMSRKLIYKQVLKLNKLYLKGKLQEEAHRQLTSKLIKYMLYLSR